MDGNPIRFNDPRGDYIGVPPEGQIDYSKPYQTIGYSQAWVHDEIYGSDGDEHGWVACTAKSHNGLPNAPNGATQFYFLQQKPILSINSQSDIKKVIHAIATPKIEVDLPIELYSVNIPFKSKSSEFLDEKTTDLALSEIIDRINTTNEAVTIIPQGNFTNYEKYTDEQKDEVNKLIQKRGEAIKQRLVDDGVEESKINIIQGSAQSGTTSTSFEFTSE